MQETFNISISQDIVWYFLLALSIILIYSNLPFKKHLRKKQEHLSAKAVVLHVETTGSNSLSELKVQIQVMPDKGRNFVTEFNTTLSSKSLSLRAGSTIQVHYNPLDQKDIIMII